MTLTRTALHVKVVIIILISILVKFSLQEMVSQESKINSRRPIKLLKSEPEYIQTKFPKSIVLKKSRKYYKEPKTPAPQSYEVVDHFHETLPPQEEDHGDLIDHEPAFFEPGPPRSVSQLEKRVKKLKFGTPRFHFEVEVPTKKAHPEPPRAHVHPHAGRRRRKPPPRSRRPRRWRKKSRTFTKIGATLDFANSVRKRIKKRVGRIIAGSVTLKARVLAKLINFVFSF
ncbi:uncharacterized protein LOC110857052 [Folsomia candida]|uniref:uncharacterized protein LOC110857052 n=1 Tax=Folsomia candida TaxID=158441 RepID=UPI000B8F006D|nr:uncharacterized protein LOC110857052 [Folsomia candida]